MSETDFIARITSLSAEARKKTLAKALINCRYAPPGYASARWQAFQARAYHQLRPYPVWAFQEWKTEERGTLPRCMPLPRAIVNKGAEWLFGREVQIVLPGNLPLEKSFRTAWLHNEMRTRTVAAAKMGGVDGGIALKWNYDETRKECPLRFQFLNLIDECRLFCDPHDRNTVLLVRVQYAVWNPNDGQWYLYREEWTEEEEIHYQPVACVFGNLRGTVNGRPADFGQIPLVSDGKQDPDVYEKWEIVSQKPNPFGMIPVVPIRNIDTDGPYGQGDLWTDEAGGMFRVIDRINLAYHIADRSNQFDSTPTIAVIDGVAPGEALPQGVEPGGIIEINSPPAEEGRTHQAKIEMLEPAGKMRESISEYALDLRKLLLDAVGSVMLDQAEITNKGNLTQAVLTQMYAPLILATEGKRQTYGENGICKALERCAVSLKNLGAKMEGVKTVNPDREETFDAQLKWQDYFALTEEEKTTRVMRITTEMTSSLLPHERAIEEIAKTEGIDDVQALKDELASEIDRQKTLRDAEADTAVGTAKQALNPPKPAGTGVK